MPTVDRRTAQLPVVEFHGLKREYAEALGYLHNLEDSYDVTPLVQRVSWSDSVEPPWETISLAMQVPMRHWFEVFPGQAFGGDVSGSSRGGPLRSPETGFWVVLRLPSSKSQGAPSTAIAWGRATTLAPGAMVTGAGLVESIPVQVQVTSWLSWLQDSSLKLSPGVGWGARGFVYDLQSWFQGLQPALAQALQSAPGTILDMLWREVVQLTLPNTLVGDEGTLETVASMIPVVHTASLAEKWTPLRKRHLLEVPGNAVNEFRSTLPTNTLWNLLASTFLADPRAVEFFPSLEWPCYKPDVGDDTRNGAPELNALGVALGGAQPVLVYRLKPMQQFPLKADMLQALSDDKRDWAPTAAERADVFQTFIDPDPACDVEWYTVKPDEIVHFRPVWQDGSRINAVAVRTAYNQQQAPVEFLGLSQPQVSAASARTHGLRWYDVDWPFAPALKPEGLADNPVTDNLLLDVQALTEMLYVLLADSGGQYFSATMITRYKPWVKKGFWVKVIIADESGTFPGMGLTGYVQTATHDADLGGKGEVSAQTTLQLDKCTMRPVAGYPRRFSLPPHNYGVNDTAPAKFGGKVDTKPQAPLPPPVPAPPYYYKPGSKAMVALFQQAAAQAGLPASWAALPSLANLVSHESGGYVGRPNYVYGNIWLEKNWQKWPALWQQWQMGKFPAISSRANGLGMLQPGNIKKFYPGGYAGIGNPLAEAVGMLRYIKSVYGTPDKAWAVWQTKKWY
uniref:Uncharacterized protein n=1 Tax=uncultured Caudovirales phage TaxID=2100421 RepID=A0A6J5L9W2_9CAUD|nr:hypothetical protein UFOVP114_47 [uncultured Caudovirales phage]